MKYEKLENRLSIEYKFSEKITFQDIEEFNNLIEEVKNSNTKNLILNLSQVTYLDCSGLGLFLLLDYDFVNNPIKVYFKQIPQHIYPLLKSFGFNSNFKFI